MKDIIERLNNGGNEAVLTGETLDVLKNYSLKERQTILLKFYFEFGATSGYKECDDNLLIVYGQTRRIYD